LALILNLETATKVCSVSLANNGEVISIEEYFGEYAHAEKLTFFIEKVCKDAGVELSELSAVAVSKGPGSYTGLRIGVSAAKGISYSLDIPLIAVDTLKHMSVSALDKITEIKKDFLLCPMIDARRMEVYCALFNHKLNNIKEVSAEIISEDSFFNFLNQSQIYFFGDGAEKCKNVLEKNPNAIFLDNIHPSSASMAILAQEQFDRKQFEDVAYFEPFYLKDFITTFPKSKI
jgi:tRNA threonylcarbamoyladenosine biosynthesis protein TsaB